MNAFLLTISFILAVSALPNNEWNRYKEEYNKVYTSEMENVRRLEQYLKTKEMVEEHNRRYERGETSYTMGINQFADWFPEELNNKLGHILEKPKTGGRKFELPPGTRVPDSINWVEKGAVTRVKDEGKCRAGYAFSAAGALEGLMFRTNKTITELSAQELVDCTDNGGCNGGIMDVCFRAVEELNGISTEESYPYKGIDQTCGNGTKGASCNGFVFLKFEGDLVNAVGAVGPVSVGFYASRSLVHYKGGIYRDNCYRGMNHGMLVVGYGIDEETKTPYWLVKNSWGPTWGENGYVRVLRNNDECGIADYALYPVYL